MKYIIVCPDYLPGAEVYLRKAPVALIPLFGRTLLDHALENLSRQGVREVLVLCSDRPAKIRAAIEQSSLWGISVRLISAGREFSPAEAFLHYSAEFQETSDLHSVSLLDIIPAANPRDFIEMINSDYSAQITMKETSPGVWVSTQANVHRTAILEGPCWIGPQAKIAVGAQVRSGSIVERGSVIGKNAILENCWLGPKTVVGEGTGFSGASLWGSGSYNFEDQSLLVINDNFLLRDLEKSDWKVSMLSQSIALFLLILTLPAVAVFALVRLLQNKPVFSTRRVAMDGTAENIRRIRSLAGVEGVAGRWPELLLVLQLKTKLIGNRPLHINSLSQLNGIDSHSWFQLPPGILSMADAEGVDGANPEEALPYAAWYSAHACRRLRAFILFHSIANIFRKETFSYPETPNTINQATTL